MTRKSRSRRGRRGMDKGEQIEIVSGTEQFTTSVTGLTQRVMVPFSFTRALAIADSFAFYRFRRMHIEIHPGRTSNGLGLGAAFLPGVAPDTPPASINAVMNLPYSKFHSETKSVETYIKLGPKELISDSPTRWYKTLAGTPDAQWEQQGVIYFWSDDPTPEFDITFRYELELQGWVTAANTPQPLLTPSGQLDNYSLIRWRGASYVRVDDATQLSKPQATLK